MKFEAPIQDGSLQNPDWTEEQNRRFDSLEDIETPATARRRALGESGRSATELAEVERLAADIARSAIEAKSKKSKPKRAINRPSNKPQIYDRDKTVESIYGKPGEL